MLKRLNKCLLDKIFGDFFLMADAMPEIRIQLHRIFFIQPFVCLRVFLRLFNKLSVLFLFLSHTTVIMVMTMNEMERKIGEHIPVRKQTERRREFQNNPLYDAFIILSL